MYITLLLLHSVNRYLKRLADETDGNFLFEYSPESFTGTEIDYALDVCNAVLDVWQPRPDWKVIINLPVTVQLSMPHVYASQIEYMSKHMKYRENVVLSLHPHNDRGCGVADTELALLAGADRVEGTLFGNGERTGNVDIITLALNMYTHGVDPKLDFSNLPELTKVYERLTRMSVYERQPYRTVGICCLLWISSGCDCQRYALERRKTSRALEYPISSNRSTRCWT